MRTTIKSAIGTLVLFAAGQAEAVPFVLDFERLGNVERIEEFYNGGLGGFGNGPGLDVDLSFGTDALAVVDQDTGEGGNFGNEASPDTIMFFLTGSVILNVPNGFDPGFSFFCSAINFPGTVQVFEGPDATGTSLDDY